MAEKNVNIEANTQFEKEQEANLTVEQLSYICDYCGKVNPLGAVRCTRCGKRRPRNEYIKAMDRVKNAQTIRREYIAEQALVAEEHKDNEQKALVRLVESRVEDEKRTIIEQESTKLEQETDAIKKATARDAVLRVIAVEQATADKLAIMEKTNQEKVAKISDSAEARVIEAENRVKEALSMRNIEISKLVEDEKARAIQVAAEKLVAERAGIEQAAKEQIELNKKIAEKYVAEAVNEEKDKSQKATAREAVLRIIAAEQVAEDKVKANTDAIHRAAVDRIVEERLLAEKEAEAKFLAQKQAIEKAADERIKAERSAMRKLMESNNYSEPATTQGNYNANPYNNQLRQTVQPFAIVPYVSSTQPLYQYKPHQVYKFVPAPQPQVEAKVKGENKSAKKEIAVSKAEEYDYSKDGVVENNKAKKKVRIANIFVIVFTLAILAFGALIDVIKADSNLLPIINPTLFVASNLSVLEAYLSYMVVGINKLFNATLNNPFAQTAFFNLAAGKLSVLIPIGFFLFMLFNIIAIIQSVIRLITGKTAKGGWVINLIQVLTIIVSAVGLATVGAERELLGTALTSVGLIVMLVLSVVNLGIQIVFKNVKVKANDEE